MIKSSLKILKRLLKKGFYYVFILNSRIRIKNLKSKEKICLELGAGKKGNDVWTTIDCNLSSDIFWDLRNGIPFSDNSIDLIYTSHMFEHIPFKELKNLIKECHRCLKKGGSLSVCVPSAGYYINAYINKKRYRPAGTGWEGGLCETDSFIDQINQIAYMGGQHKYMFDEENLIKILKICGFKKASLRKFDPSLDREDRDFESIYSLAYK